MAGIPKADHNAAVINPANFAALPKDTILYVVGVCVPRNPVFKRLLDNRTVFWMDPLYPKAGILIEAVG